MFGNSAVNKKVLSTRLASAKLFLEKRHLDRKARLKLVFLSRSILRCRLALFFEKKIPFLVLSL